MRILITGGSGYLGQFLVVKFMSSAMPNLAEVGYTYRSSPLVSWEGVAASAAPLLTHHLILSHSLTRAPVTRTRRGWRVSEST